MRKHLLIIVAMTILGCLSARAQTGQLPRSAPAAQGVDPAVLTAFFDSLLALPYTQVHHVMVLRHDTVIGELHVSPFAADDLNTVYSASKTVTALAVGLAIDDGLLNVDDKVSQHLRDKMPDTLSAALDSLTVRHLLMMGAGTLQREELFRGSEDWLTAWFKGDFSEPGKHFHYDSMCTHALAAIVTRVTGKPLLQLVRERIFEPIGITVNDWEVAPDSIQVGAWGLRLQAESEARLGILMLRQGNWHGTQLVSSQWIDDMTQRYLSTATAPPPQLSLGEKIMKFLRTVWHEVRSWFTGVNVDDYYEGYGFQIKSIQQPRTEAFFAVGYGGQVIYVVPSCDMVIVFNAMSRNYGEMVTMAYNQLITALLTSDNDEALPTDSVVPTATIDPPRGAATSPQEHLLLGLPITLDDNSLGLQTILLNRRDGGLGVTLVTDKGDQTFTAVCGSWVRCAADDIPLYATLSNVRFRGTRLPLTMVHAYAWSDATHLTLESIWLDGGDFLTLGIGIDEGNGVTVDYNDNNDPLLTGTVEGHIQ